MGTRATRTATVTLALMLLGSGSIAACGLDVNGATPDGADDASTDGTSLDGPGDDAGDTATGDDANGGNDTGADVVNEAGDGGSLDAADASDAQDAAKDTGVDSGNDAGADSSSSSGYLCDGGRVTSCAQCTGATLDCLYCATDGGSATEKSCVASGGRCANIAPSGYAVCPCAYPDASACFLPTQVCHNGSDGKTCRTCGESNTSGDGCKDGGTCNGSGVCN